MSDYTITVEITGENKLSGTLRLTGQDLQRFNGEMRNTKQHVDQADLSLRGVNRTLSDLTGGVLGGLALRQVIGFAESMNELGTQANANRVIFESLTHTMGSSADVMRMLRDATGGVIDDMTLMGETSRILRLGLADSADDAGKLIRMITQLKDPTVSVTEAIRNFSLMLSNESLLRLDTFGISSANVKRRMDELGQSFREAAMAEMAEQVKMLGDAADVAITPLARIQTHIDNIAQTLGANLNVGVNSVAGFLLAVGQNLAPGGSAYDSEVQYQRMLELGTQMYPEVGRGQKYTDAQWADIQNTFNGRLQRAESFRRMVNTWRGVMDAAGGAIEQELRLELSRMRFSDQFGRQPYEVFYPSGLSGQLEALQQSAQSVLGSISIFSPETVARAHELAAQAERLAGLGEVWKPYIDSGLISQTDVDRMRQVADEAADFAKEAEKGAKALHDASLTTLLGQGGGARSFMDLGRLSLQAISDTGISAEALADLTDAVQLATGEQTANSLALRDDILPLLADIYSQQGQDAYIQALQDLSGAIQGSWTSGIPLTPEMMMRSIGWMYQPGSTGGETLHVGMGDTPWDIRQRTGMSYEEIMAATGWSGLGYYDLRPGDYQIGGGELMRTGAFGDTLGGITSTLDTIRSSADVALDPMVTASESIVSAGTEFKNILDDLTGSVHKVTIDLSVTAPAILEWLFAQIGGGDEGMAKIVRANGGVVPGSDPRSRQIER